MSWKNGGGTTEEVCRSPLVGMPDWRVSIATIAQDGPFSRFDDLDRHLAVLSGRLLLQGLGHGPVLLEPGSAPVRFPGSAPVLARPLGGHAIALNLMTGRGRFLGSVVPLRDDGIVTGAAATVIVASRDARFRIDGTTHHLKRLDAAAVGIGRHLAGDASVLMAEIDPLHP
ncbi:MAG: HutD family protein [Sphingomonas adhaesiva]|uniref:HutD/Ves family protein n=1 Tax=Sphingomonas adhaesiva TaxID=28212 RepID=UPI002FF7E79C